VARAPNELSPSKRLKKGGVRVLASIAAHVYLAYMTLVAWTSRIDRGHASDLVAQAAGGRTITLAILHQDVVAAPYLFRDLGVVTLASRGDAGEVISALLERCNFRVVRGGSSAGSRTRRSPTAAFRELVERASAGDGRGAIIAITPDGSRGPAGAVKAGIALLARTVGSDVYCLKIHARRARYLDTWDRTMIPLPFNDIHVYLDGPIRPPATSRRADVEVCRREVEDRLHEIHRRAFARDHRAPVPELQRLDVGATTGVTS
jgi:lysophospholipid acyltransferase (LPLAT)-like uncharacterized protein